MDNQQHSPPAPPMPPTHPTPPPPPPTAPPKPQTKLSPRMIIFAVVGVLAIVLIIFLCFGRSSNDLTSASLPTHHHMTMDAKAALSDEGLPNQILNLEIDNESLSERFKTYVVDCTVTVSAEGETAAYALTLYYEYANEQWSLSNTSSPLKK